MAARELAHVKLRHSPEESLPEDAIAGPAERLAGEEAASEVPAPRIEALGAPFEVCEAASGGGEAEEGRHEVLGDAEGSRELRDDLVHGVLRVRSDLIFKLGHGRGLGRQLRGRDVLGPGPETDRERLERREDVSIGHRELSGSSVAQQKQLHAT